MKIGATAILAQNLPRGTIVCTAGVMPLFASDFTVFYINNNYNHNDMEE